jgi:endonuclease G, mitochondrial
VNPLLIRAAGGRTAYRDTELNVAIVQVAASEAARIREYARPVTLAPHGKIVSGESISIIQHPGGSLKQIALMDGRVVDKLDMFLHYTGSTAPGSSGAPVLNAIFEVIAIHLSRVPEMRDGQYTDLNGQPWDGRDVEDVHWIAKEGILISALIDAVRQGAPDLIPKLHLATG